MRDPSTGQSSEMLEPIAHEAVKSLPRSGPDDARAIFEDSPDRTAGKTVGHRKRAELAIRKAAQTFAGGKPYRAVVRDDDAGDDVVGHSAIRRVLNEPAVVISKCAPAPGSDPEIPMR